MTRTSNRIIHFTLTAMLTAICAGACADDVTGDDEVGDPDEQATATSGDEVDPGTETAATDDAGTTTTTTTTTSEDTSDSTTTTDSSDDTDSCDPAKFGTARFGCSHFGS